MESMNPGGTGKDRAAKKMMQDALLHKHFRKGAHIVEGTSGSTGIALAGICNALGLNLHIVMPDDQSIEKRTMLERLGAKITIVPCCSISNRNHYVNAARRLAEDLNGIFINQFENYANFTAHYEDTGPEIWKQCNENITCFVMSAGTGGTIAGVSRFLKEKNPLIKVYLADVNGSSLHRFVKYGVCYTPEQSERTVKKHRYDSIAEGIGLDRLTNNFKEALIDDSELVHDQDIVEMAHWLLRNEGLFVGSSSAANIAAACRFYQRHHRNEPNVTVVTVVCDSGHRHLSRLWSPTYIAAAAETYQVHWPEPGVLPSCFSSAATSAVVSDAPINTEK